MLRQRRLQKRKLLPRLLKKLKQRRKLRRLLKRPRLLKRRRKLKKLPRKLKLLRRRLRLPKLLPKLPLLKPLLQEVAGPGVRLVDSAITVAEQAARTLAGLGLAHPGDTLPTYRYTVTDIPLRFQTIGERFLGRSLGTVERVQW